MNRFVTILILLILSLAPIRVWAEDYHIYVASTGSDSHSGLSVSEALTNPHLALRMAREHRRLFPSDAITLHLSGPLSLTAPLTLRPEDSGTAEAPFIIDGTGVNDAEGGASLSSLMPLTQWRRKGQWLVCSVPDFQGYPLDFRQLYVGGTKAIRARDIPLGLNEDPDADPFEQMAHILSLNPEQRILYVPTTPAIRQIARQGVQQAELVLHEMWCISYLRIRSLEVKGDSAAVQFHEPESTIQWEHPWPFPMTGAHASPFFLTNHPVLLNEPGEWYYDRNSHLLYYYPRTKAEANQLLAGEMVAAVPTLETLLRIEGTPERPVHDVEVRHLTFEGSTWLRPSQQGHVPLQAGMYLTEAYRLRPKMIRPDRNHKLDNQGFCGRPAAAVYVTGAERISFTACEFRHCASSALDIDQATSHCSVTHSHFHDLGGSAIVAGSFGPESFEGHLPYAPQDPRLRCLGLNIVSNYIHDVGQEDWGTLGIAAGWVTDITIAHNTIHHVPYSGISVGWGWTQSLSCMSGNQIYRNYIHHYAQHLYDVSGIYTLSAQPKTFIFENVIDSICHPSYVHDPNHWFYLYCDEGSSFITVRDNWCPAEKFLRNANGPANDWQNNGPQVADSIRLHAGCSPYCPINGPQAH